MAFKRKLAASLLLGTAALIGVAASSFASAPQAAPARPKRIVSLNLCTDQLLVGLADRDQIAGLTRNADDAEMSAVAARTKGLPILRGSAEQILTLKPDLVIGMPASLHPAMTMLGDKKPPTLDLESADDYGDVTASIRTVAKAVGHPERGEAMIARMDRELAQLGSAGGGKVAAYYQRRGYMTGTGTLIDDLMKRVGLVNLAGKLDKPPLAMVSLEEMVAARPDFLVVESATDRVADQGTEMLHHPALDRIKRISVPQAWTVCGSEAYVAAARRMADEARRLH